MKNKSIFLSFSQIYYYFYGFSRIVLFTFRTNYFLFFLVKNLSTKKIFLIILLNFSAWFVQIDFLEIKYKDKIEECSAPNAIDAEFKLSIKDGSITRFLSTRSKIMCWLDSQDPARVEKIINGEALK